MLADQIITWSFHLSLTMLYNAILCYATLYYTILYSLITVLFYTILCYTLLYSALQCYTVLCYSILSILCSTVLSYTILWPMVCYVSVDRAAYRIRCGPALWPRPSVRLLGLYRIHLPSGWRETAGVMMYDDDGWETPSQSRIYMYEQLYALDVLYALVT